MVDPDPAYTLNEQQVNTIRMDQNTYIRQILSFLEESPTPFHAVGNICNILRENGFSELHEKDSWVTPAPGSYFIQRNGSSLILFNLADDNCS